MLGGSRADASCDHAEPGIIPNAMTDLFSRIQNHPKTFGEKIEVIVSFVEVYNEQVYDLFEANSKVLSLREDSEKGVVRIAGVTEIKIDSPEDVMASLFRGNKNRKTEATMANTVSSRSHAIFQVLLRQTKQLECGREQVIESKLSLIDLAGSERASATNNRGLRLQEGANINKSLLALANCINALAENSQSHHNKKINVKYRDSKLTHLLKSSLEGNSYVVMIANINPSHLTYEDSHNTLKYSNRAKNIRLSPILKSNALRDCSSAERELKLREENEHLRHQVAELNGVIQSLKHQLFDAQQSRDKYFYSTKQQDDENESQTNSLSCATPFCAGMKSNGMTLLDPRPSISPASLLVPSYSSLSLEGSIKDIWEDIPDKSIDTDGEQVESKARPTKSPSKRIFEESMDDSYVNSSQSSRKSHGYSNKKIRRPSFSSQASINSINSLGNLNSSWSRNALRSSQRNSSNTDISPSKKSLGSAKLGLGAKFPTGGDSKTRRKSMAAVSAMLSNIPMNIPTSDMGKGGESNSMTKSNQPPLFSSGKKPTFDIFSDTINDDTIKNRRPSTAHPVVNKSSALLPLSENQQQQHNTLPLQDKTNTRNNPSIVSKSVDWNAPLKGHCHDLSSNKRPSLETQSNRRSMKPSKNAVMINNYLSHDN